MNEKNLTGLMVLVVSLLVLGILIYLIIKIGNKILPLQKKWENRLGKFGIFCFIVAILLGIYEYKNTMENKIKDLEQLNIKYLLESGTKGLYEDFEFGGCHLGNCINGYGTWSYMKKIKGSYVYQGKYEGEFKNGKRNGKGRYTFANGAVEEGLWENNEFIGKE